MNRKKVTTNNRNKYKELILHKDYLKYGAITEDLLYDPFKDVSSIEDTEGTHVTFEVFPITKLLAVNLYI
jgi:hypothetical protein